MFDQDSLRAVLEFGGEQRSVEFKGAGDITSKDYVAKVARAALALSNFRGGGAVILGIDGDDPLTGQNGLDEKQLADWKDVDLVNAKINAYADPALELTIVPLVHPSGSSVIALNVAEFRDYPTMCKQDYGSVLFEGQLFTRSAAKPESAYRQTHGEMREVIDLAVEKNLTDFLRIAQGGGLTFSEDGRSLVPNSFHAQLEAAVRRNGELVTEPHLRFTIQPGLFIEDRLDLRSLRKRVSLGEVRHAGWSYPALEHVGQGQDWVAGGQRHGAYGAEAWIFYRSGLYTSSTELSSVEPDRRLQLPPQADQPRFMPVHEPLMLITLFLEFATRQAAALTAQRNERVKAENRPGEGMPLAAEEQIVSIEAHGVRNWALAAADPQRNPLGFGRLFKYDDDVLKLDDIVLWPGASVPESRATALIAASSFFHHFGWNDASPDLLRDIQERVVSN
jgi:hypothetical protein